MSEEELVKEAQRLRRVPGRLEEAVAAAELAAGQLMGGAEAVTALCLAGELRQEAAQWSLAAEHFQRAVDIDPEGRAGKIGLALAKGMLPGGDQAAATSVLTAEEGAGGTGLSGDDLIRLGRARVALGDDEKGAALLNKAWSRGAGGDATFELGLAAQRKYCASVRALGAGSEAGLIDKALEQYKKCRRDGRAFFNSGLLAEERYHRTLMWRSAGGPKEGTDSDGMPFKPGEMGEMSAHSMEDEIAAIASSAGLFQPTINEILKALIEEHRLQQERGDSFQADYVMQLYHFKSRQLLAAGGKVDSSSTKTDPNLKAAAESYQEALKADKDCGALVYLHLARVQATLGKFDTAAATLKKVPADASNPAAKMYRAMYESPPTPDNPCPKPLLAASDDVKAVVAAAVEAGASLPGTPLSAAVAHVLNVDLVRAACALAEAHNKAGEFADSKALMAGLAETVPGALGLVSKGTVAYQELRVAAAKAQEGLLVSLAGLKETEAAAPLYEAVYPVLSDNPRWTIPEIDKLIAICKVGVEVCPKLAAAHTRLAAAEYLRVDYDPSLSKPSAKAERQAALERCEKGLRASLALEGKPSRDPPSEPQTPPKAAEPPAQAGAADATPTTTPEKSEEPPPAAGKAKPSAALAAKRSPAAAASPSGGARGSAARASPAATKSPAGTRGSPASRAPASPAARASAASPTRATAGTRSKTCSSGTPASRTGGPASRVTPASPVGRAAGATKTSGAAAKLGAAKTAAASPSSKIKDGKPADAPKEAAPPPGTNPTPPETATPTKQPAVVPLMIPDNPKLVQTRVELGKVMKERYGQEMSDEQRQELVGLYHEVMEMEPKCVDAYTGISAVLAPSSPEQAIEEMAKFPMSDPPNFDDSYIHIDILQLYMQVGKKDRKALDAPQLEKSLLIAGKVLGFPGIDKYVDFLDGKGRWGMLRRVHASINSVPESEMQDFFEAKGWPADEED